MKNLFFLLLCSITLTFISCGNDDDCNDNDSLENTIVGNWTLYFEGVPAALGDIEFKANGDFVHDENILIPEQVGGATVTSKTYTVQSDDMLTLTATSSAGSNDFPIDVTSFDCDEINLNVQGVVDYELKRKD